MRTPFLPEALTGLAPIGSTPCRRCARPTISLANGRGRLEICEPCGRLDISTAEGFELFSMRDPTVSMRRQTARKH